MGEGAQALANLDGLDFLSIKVRLQNDVLTVAGQLLDFEGSHDSLDAVILDLVMPVNLAHVVAELFADVGAHLGLLLSDVVEHICYAIGHVLTELESGFFHHG